MNRRTLMTAATAAGAMAALILDGRTALEGAAAGVDLCIRTVIPSLFPFLFFCGILTNSLWGNDFPILRPVSKRLGIPDGADSLLIAAILGGYPAGAQVVGEAYTAGRLDKDTAEHLLTFCSNAGPAFLFGMTAMQFEEKSAPWALWSILLLSAYFAGITHKKPPVQRTSLPVRTVSVSGSLWSAVRTMGLICGWIVLFRILIFFLDRWVLQFLPAEAQVLTAGILELSNGCCMLTLITDPSIRFLICCILLTFGGLCVTMQTASVIGDLSLKPYLRGKLIQTVASMVLSLAYLAIGLPGLILPGLGMVIFPRTLKKRGRFPAVSGV